ncbi:RNA-guided endonuclease TnpB family protein [Candidatus Chloroploca sp. Khr17]|uniref:RNA-guided endonuclease InsQ/TnpB family protein n=1 Tax=Candidatus Chloroploca sp. Khr17 TaxID=2496869 RepID=UPI00101BE632|nr:RNA-guided endonuclease TnpB family protein [Candidatus Chloroploca sp. Khr17]
MQLVEQHVINRSDTRFALIDAAAFAAKNLHNAANYIVRQAFIFDGRYLNYHEMNRRMKTTEPYQALPRKVSQQVLMLLDKNWKSFFAALATYRTNPAAFTGKPGLPTYLDKTKGRFALVYTIQAISRPALAQQVIKPSGLDIHVQTKQTRIAQVRIVPRSGFYVVEVIYERAVEPAAVDPQLVAGIDIGLNNLAAIASNKPGFVPVLVHGRPIKHINQFYNKRKAHLQAKLGAKGTTALMERITVRRNRQITHYLHTHSHRIIELLVEEGIGTLVIGKNDGWKQEIALGRRTNQNFVQVPHARFIEMLTYKAKLVGITVVVRNESHTSKCSFFDDEPVAHHDQYVGRRIKRGLFRTRDGRLINADVNGAYNIIRKAIPNAFSNGIEGVVGHPVGSAPTY